MPSLSSRYTPRFAASKLMAERSRVNSSTAAAMASGGSAGFNRSNAERKPGHQHLLALRLAQQRAGEAD
jgi:hypothetical protein